MKAYILKQIGILDFEETEKPVPNSGEVIVEVRAAGICGSDIPRIYRTGTYSYPLIPGHEFSGVVTELGTDCDREWLGKRVGVFPLIPCRKCGPCQNGQYEMCRHYSYIGSRRAGAFGEYAAVPAWNLVPLPDNVTFEQAAMLEPMSVAVHAMDRAIIGQDSTVAIWGLGTIGLLLLMVLAERGIRKILLIGNKPFQKETAIRLGMEEKYYCDVREKDVVQWINDMTDSQGADIFFDCVGKNEVVAKAVQCTAPGGQVVLVGNPASDMTLDRQAYWKILRNQLTVRGTWNSSFGHEGADDWQYCMKGLEEGRFSPETLISHRLPFDRLIQGLEIMRDKREDYIKVMMVK